MQKDENRDKYLESHGFTGLRFENRFVFQKPEYLKNNQPPRPVSVFAIL
ncbi:MAG: DUF559 domain-containing protein [Bacteroidales bacterium]|nr:DUF559 domain-containing protein [Bacteroidales bacterium]